jgi:D-glycero-alpha-D-manno-heptose-7-phosphate kinase
MIITRSPLRITLGGGGTDVPSYYKQHEGFLIAAAIDKYVYITLHETFIDELILKYSALEKVSSIDEIKHPIIREAFRLSGLDGHSLELTSMADIPAGTGLGSSGSFTTALLKALHTYKRTLINPAALAEQASHIEIDRLNEPCGKQDQYIAAFGGITCFSFAKDGSVDAWPLRLKKEILHSLEDQLCLFFTGYSRKSSSILTDQDLRTKANDKEMIHNLHHIKEMGYASKAALEAGDLKAFAEIMNNHWQQKRARTQGMSNQNLDRWYDLAIQNGALGGKLIGAGGGGFFLFLAEDKTALRKAMLEEGLAEVRFRFDFEGTKVLIQ